jgi:hypothetical protein
VGAAYGPGVSKVRLKGSVSAVDTGAGTASLGDVTVDYTALLSTDPDAAPDVGGSFATVGIQPIPRGVVLAGPSASGTVGCSALGGRL